MKNFHKSHRHHSIHRSFCCTQENYDASLNSLTNLNETFSLRLSYANVYETDVKEALNYQSRLFRAV